MKKFLLVIILLSSISSLLADDSSSDTIVILYSGSDTQTQYFNKDQYFLGILKLIARKIPQPIVLQPIPLGDTRESRLKEILKKGKVNIAWMATSSTLEEELLPIRVPLYKGLIGWRVLLIHKDNQAQIEKLKSVDSLKKLIAGLGHDWPDSDVFEHNDFLVHRSPSWPGLFKLLESKRIDYFPRGSTEIYQEWFERKDTPLVIERRFVFHYPASYYLFFSKENRELKELFERGLMRAIDDGSFDRHFYSYYGDDIKQLNLKQREVIQLTNPNAHPDTPLSDKRLWFR